MTVLDHADGAPPEDGSASMDALLAFLLLFFVPQLVIPFLGPGEDSTARVESDSMILLSGLIPVVGFAVYRRHTLRWRLRWSSLGLYLVFLLAWVPLAMLLYPAVLEWLGVEFDAQKALRYFVHAPAGAGYWVVLFCTCVAAPVGEELLFRGFLYRAVVRKVSPWLAVAITSALFGVIHGWMFALPIGVLGGFFGWLRLRTGGVGSPILVHMVHNAWTVGAVTLWPNLFSEVYGK